MNKYYLSKNYPNLSSAGNKAKTDIETILSNAGFVNIGLKQTHYNNKLLGFIFTLLGVLKASFLISKGDWLVLQYPLKKYFSFICKVAHLKGGKVTVVIHVSLDGSVPDLFQSLTDVIEMDETFFSLLGSPNEPEIASYRLLWKTKSDELKSKRNAFTTTMPYSDLFVLNNLLPLLPERAALQLGNSSSIRNAQLFDLNADIPVYCNRGTSGIDGSMSTAVGFSAIHPDLTFLVIGDLSFFYDVNGLWNKHINKNLRIMLVNNGGGEIFHLLPGLNKAESLDDHISYRHNTVAKEWAQAMFFTE